MLPAKGIAGFSEKMCRLSYGFPLKLIHKRNNLCGFPVFSTPPFFIFVNQSNCFIHSFFDGEKIFNQIQKVMVECSLDFILAINVNKKKFMAV